MNKQKTFWVSFLVIASVLVLMNFASANVSFTSVKVNGIETNVSGVTAAVTAGTSIPVVVTFNATTTESNVWLRAELQGVNGDVQSQVFVGNIITGQTYTESLTLTVPSNIGDVQNDSISLVLTAWNGDFQSAQSIIHLGIQRQSYNVGVMQLSTVDSANAGSLLPVNVVLKNIGYNDLSDVYVTVSVPSLGLQRTAYFGDLTNPTTNNDTTSGTIYIQLPYSATPGTYTVQAEIRNSYLDTTATDTFVINNEFQSNVIADNSQQTSGIGQAVTYNLEVVNPTTNIQVYQIVPQTISGVTISTDSIVTVPAGSSRTVSLTANAASAGNYNMTVNVFSGGQLTGNVALGLNAQGGVSNPVVILTIVLAIIFVVLLVVLLVLVTKKPKKQEGLNESYY
jgi:preprotein translocase subunit SecG